LAKWFKVQKNQDYFFQKDKLKLTFFPKGYLLPENSRGGRWAAMAKRILDALDNKIIRLLAEDGRMPVGEMASRLRVTAPTVRSRIKALEEAGKLKISGLIDPYENQEITTALIGLNIQSHGKLDHILEKLAHLDNVVWAAVVTGRYDVFLEVVVTGGTTELYRLTTDVIPKVGTVVRSETFVIMKSRRKWVPPPKGPAEV
jgi:Lrp/AsnC family transcriptional regulator for asnA, asnC and gidA